MMGDHGLYGYSFIGSWGGLKVFSVFIFPPRTGKLFRFRFSFSFRVVRVRVVRAKLCVRVRDDFPLGRLTRGL